MVQTKMWIALTIAVALFFLTGAQVFTYAQTPNMTSMAGNMTNATMANATSAGNMSGNISGCDNTRC
jgi:hypothetical protein